MPWLVAQHGASCSYLVEPDAGLVEDGPGQSVSRSRGSIIIGKLVREIFERRDASNMIFIYTACPAKC